MIRFCDGISQISMLEGITTLQHVNLNIWGNVMHEVWCSVGIYIGG